MRALTLTELRTLRECANRESMPCEERRLVDDLVHETALALVRRRALILYHCRQCSETFGRHRTTAFHVSLTPLGRLALSLGVVS